MSESQFVDFCPSIKPNDHKYNDVVRMLKHNGCLEENSRLTKCLQDNKKNFAKCTVRRILLSNRIRHSVHA